MAKIFSDRWTMIKPLSEGGQAHTFLVVDNKGEASIHYVLKRLKNLHRLPRFKKEYETLRKLRDPGIVHVIDFDFGGVNDNKPFFVTEFCERGNLAEQEQLLRGTISTKVQSFLEICRGLQAAHKAGITHRDIKPENVFVRKDGSVALGDFGLCYDQAQDVRLTARSEPIGSRYFIAPEYENGRADEVTHAGDIYSLGKLLYWLLSGGTIFSRENFREPRYDLRTIVETGNSVLNQLTEQFNLVLDKMITVRPEGRISIEEVIQQIQRAERLWTLEYALPTSCLARGLCRHCGQGNYVPCNDSPTNFGIEQRGQHTLKILVCNWCGHVELFRPDNTLAESPARQYQK